MRTRLQLILCVLLACFESLTVQADTINVAVAANFKQTLENLKPEFEKNSDHTINIISASTGQLLQQITQGAPYDIFLAANTAHPQTLWQQMHNRLNLDKDALQIYSYGRLVFFSNDKLKNTDILETLLLKPEFKRLSMANPRLAPYGLAAKQTLECLKVYKTKKSHMIVGQNVAQAFQFIDTNNVNGGFVAMSQVLDKNLDYVRVIDKACYDPIKQTGLRLNNKQSSHDFMDFLAKASTKTIIEQHGYRVPN